MLKNAKPKLFICYAGKHQSLMNDFMFRIEDHLKNSFEILCSRSVYSKNMHKTFAAFASQCNVAVLLLNAKFATLESYVTNYEMPVLLERLRKGNVVLVPVIFSDCDYAIWNDDRNIHFFDIRNDELPCTRRSDAYGDEFNSRSAVYEQIKSEDRETYCLKLAKRIIQLTDVLDIEENLPFDTPKDFGMMVEETLPEEVVQLINELDEINKKFPIETNWDSKNIRNDFFKTIAENNILINCPASCSEYLRKLVGKGENKYEISLCIYYRILIEISALINIYEKLKSTHREALPFRNENIKKLQNIDAFGYTKEIVENKKDEWPLLLNRHKDKLIELQKLLNLFLILPYDADKKILKIQDDINSIIDNIGNNIKQKVLIPSRNQIIEKVNNASVEFPNSDKIKKAIECLFNDLSMLYNQLANGYESGKNGIEQHLGIHKIQPPRSKTNITYPEINW